MAVCLQTNSALFYHCAPSISTPHQPPSTKVSGATNVNTSDIAPCLAALNECGSVGWAFYLARQHGSASVVCTEAFVFSTLQKFLVDCSSGLLCAPSRCTFKQILTSQHRLPVASQCTFQVISPRLFRQHEN